MADTNAVDEYISQFDDWRAEVMATVRSIIRTEAPGARESIKWAQPVYESNGPFAYLRAFPRSVNLGFWRGAEMDDPDGLFEGSGDRMRHVSLTARDQVRPDVFAAWVRQALNLNAAKGNPTKRR